MENTSCLTVVEGSASSRRSKFRKTLCLATSSHNGYADFTQIKDCRKLTKNIEIKPKLSGISEPAQALGMPFGFNLNAAKSDWPRAGAITRPTSCKFASSMPGSSLGPTPAHPRFKMIKARQTSSD